MNKKMMAMVATVAMAFAANAAKELVDGYTWEYTIVNGEATISGVSPASGKLIIPTQLGGVLVKKIADHAFRDQSDIDAIEISNGIESLGSYAFADTYASIIVPESVVHTGIYTFLGARIERWTVPASINLGTYSLYSSMSSCNLVLKYDVPSCFWEGQNSTDNHVYKPYYCVNQANSYFVKRAYAQKWEAFFGGMSKFAGYIDDAPEVEIVSAGVRENDPTVMDVVYKVYSDAARVKVRALAFQDGQRSLAKVVPVKTLIEGTDANIGDSVTANVEHKLSWKVSTDWATDLAKVKFEVLAVEDDILPLELQTIPATASHAAMKISWNKMTDDKVFDALLWLYASGDTGLTLTNGQLKNGGTIFASGTGIYNGQSAVTYIFGKMGYGVLNGDDLTYARRVTQLDLPTGGVQQFAVKMIAQ